MRIVRMVVSAALIAMAGVAVTLPSSPASADTVALEFYVGTPITAKADHVLTGRNKIAKGTAGKVTKVYNSGGKIVYLDVKVGEVSAVKVPVQKIRDLYDYVKH
jgi:hypothetical protein